MDRLETITVVAGGGVFTFWNDVSIEYGAEQAVRTCSLEVTDPGFGAWPLMPGTEVQVFATGTPLITGYVRDFDPGHDGDSWSGRVSIVSRTVDAVECSIDHPTGHVEKADLLEIAQTFDMLGIGFESDESFEKEPSWQVIPGESVWETVERLARQRGVLVYDTEEGKLKLATKPDGRHSGGLGIGNGGNIVRARAKLTEKDRHSPVKVRGQSTIGSGDDSLRSEAEAEDAGLSRERPKILVNEGEVTADRLKTRAEWQVRRAAGRSVSADVTVAGWRDLGGTIWTSNRLVHLADPRIYLEQDMVISRVRLSQRAGDGGEGTTATLTLLDPRALGGEDPKGGSAPAWSAEAPTATLTVG